MSPILNPILATDSYKLSHWKQYPPGTRGLFSYIEARSKKPGLDKTLFFGLQAFVHSFLARPITVNDVWQAAGFAEAHGEPFNRNDWNLIVKRYGGYLPVRIDAVPEGLVVPNGNVLVTVQSTDPELFWLGSYLETAILRAVWYPSTVATRSYQAKLIIKAALEKTGDPKGLHFKLHDFGARGVSSQESAMLGGMAHLVNFQGTDTIEGVLGARLYYGAQMAGFSIPAAEHSTITSWGREREKDAYENMLAQYAKPGATLAVVSDSYHIFDACSKLWGGELRQKVIDSGATLVIRPDSGDPATTVMECLSILGEKFGVTVNEKGFRVLNHVRLIQGDGLDGPHSIENILKLMELNGWSADNIAFGMGGGLLQNVTRDTLGFAMKCSSALIGTEKVDVYKDPIGGGKTSKRGVLQLVHGPAGYRTISENEAAADGEQPVLRPVYMNGVPAGLQGLEQVRKNTGLW